MFSYHSILNRTLATDSLVTHLVQTVHLLLLFIIPTDSDVLMTKVAGVSGVYLGAVQYLHIPTIYTKTAPYNASYPQLSAATLTDTITQVYLHYRRTERVSITLEFIQFEVVARGH